MGALVLLSPFWAKMLFVSVDFLILVLDMSRFPIFNSLVSIINNIKLKSIYKLIIIYKLHGINLIIIKFDLGIRL
ncbi:MAG: hypothetical protein COZ46_03755 [Verrucomicrobia bacterium CG_4_10_14_3_um_filter_43_23]|nr:MAG: hypothetical protein AUJ82_02900 [Verrucomicrobia bacterium CG1_02_43_26]PIP59393.1 MAG: hypothetical protein COX01_03835 [Verrucomicrobia bacterium CG22_combo_CG10-13_8_21_14_all_43_17]PIX58483.1 MAG: hypothetical protein COZ46_03755 [Verrucomicrobia bacterium CG_4_10_14_3_um_filter_43_23]PIY62233.1 MAG: hypothetical protein COY94_02650 [Verrucomicrobia bacterium CG_4_10_14_0_8_um_filter_43_34]PJA44303.1 MAG: hypothetical protein CO175_03630 [Verrucomicrobia bacterium CG_4_9_14_3_um_fi